jgi:hypothetical protein
MNLKDEDKEKLKRTFEEKFPEIVLDCNDVKECKQSLISLGKAIYLYSLQKRRESE